MPLDVSQVIDLLVKLSEEENLQLPILKLAKSAAIAGTGALIGALIAGPVGLAMGAALGGVTGAIIVKSFKPLASAIRELPAHKKRELAENVNRIISSIDHTDAIVLMNLVQSNLSIRSQVLAFMKSFFGKVEVKPIQST